MQDIYFSKKSALSFICLKVLGKNMSKFEQVSDWNSRPLRKAQIHYAALDSFVLILIYKKIRELGNYQGDLDYIDSFCV